jgi:hypothetical protein
MKYVFLFTDYIYNMYDSTCVPHDRQEVRVLLERIAVKVFVYIVHLCMNKNSTDI